MKKYTVRSIGAILLGMIVVVLLSVGTDFILESVGIFPPAGEGIYIAWMLVLAFVYRSIYAVAGGYVAATAAPGNQMRHAMILGIVGIVASTVGAIAAWDLSSHWYPIALIASSLPCTWLGGKMRTKKKMKKEI